MSNLARATNPFSKVLSSNALSVAPDKNTMLLHIVLPDQSEISKTNIPRVLYREDQDSEIGKNQTEGFIRRLANAISASKKLTPPRMTIELPGKTWLQASEDRSAQHFAITVLDAICAALDNFDKKLDKQTKEK